MKQKGLVKSKDEFWLGLDLKDLGEAGAFIENEIWEQFIMKKRLAIGATNFGGRK